jgi:putative transcriptional regulator
MHSLQGHFLVTAPHQLDPNFVERVILVVEHGDRGTFGVILNCSRELGSCERMSQRHSLGKARMYCGGPVIGPLMAVHTDESCAEIEILPGVFFAGKEENVLPLMSQTKQPYKVFTGYAGWSPEQLEHEIEHGAWGIAPGTAEQIFSSSSDLWEELSRQVYKMQLHEWYNLKHIPGDPQLN